ncbi:MAG: phosphorylcholine transferase LicD [Lachnospira sp.]
MQFSEDFYNGETIDDFYVEPMMKRAWASQLEVLDLIKSICKKYNLSYFAEWGTMLGAVRHKGFIPWDDDLDIGMLRHDFMKLLSVIEAELPDGYKYLSFYNYDEYDDYLIRIVNTDRIRIDDDFLKKHHGCPFACGVDIFPLDYVPQNEEDKELQIALLEIVNYAAQLYSSKDTNEEIEVLRDDAINQVKEALNVTFNDKEPMKRQLMTLAERICGLYNREDKDMDIGMPILMLKFRNNNYCVPRECYEKTIEVPFLNTTISIPSGYDRIMSMRYGDYMTPVKNWDSHNYPFYKSQWEILNDHLRQAGLTDSPFFDKELKGLEMYK